MGCAPLGGRARASTCTGTLLLALLLALGLGLTDERCARHVTAHIDSEYCARGTERFVGSRSDQRCLRGGAPHPPTLRTRPDPNPYPSPRPNPDPDPDPEPTLNQVHCILRCSVIAKFLGLLLFYPNWDVPSVIGAHPHRETPSGAIASAAKSSSTGRLTSMLDSPRP